MGTAAGGSQTRRKALRSAVLLGAVLVLGAGGAASAADAPLPTLTGDELMRQCGMKHPGADQQGIFTVTLMDRDGRTKRSEYLRFWKDYRGEDDVADKMLLFTTFPPDARGSSFMRVAYTPESAKPVDQWIYLPLLKKIRRVTIRDPGDSFLNSNLTYFDVSPRALDADEHRYIGTTTADGATVHVVESLPKEKRPLYSKRVFWFLYPGNWEGCVPVRIDYYDANGQLLKDQFIAWQQVDGAWMWKTSMVRSHQTGTASSFELRDMQVDVGLQDSLFSARTLERGPDIIQRHQPEG